MRNLLYFCIGGFALGVLWRSLFNFGVSFSLFIVLIGGVVFLFSRLAKEKQVVIVLVGAVFVSSGLGMIRFDITELNQGSEILDRLIGTESVSEGIVIDEPDRRENNTNYTIRLTNIIGEKVDAKVRVIAPSYPRFSYGDKVLINGELQKPEGFTTDNNKYFDYAAYLSKDDIYYQMIFPELEFISSGHGNIIKRYLFSFKGAFLSQVQKTIPDPQVSLLGGLVVGAKQSLGEKLQQDFRTTGIIHIVVLSGYNVTIVADFIMRVFSSLPKVMSMSLGAGAIVFFALMTGASATIVRASIMALLVIFARATGRTYDMTRALFIAGFFMVLHNPKILLFDVSFQLSFLATLGLILLAPLLERFVPFIPSRFQLRYFATATVATQIFVLPLLLFKVGELSLVALPVNLLVLITVPATMLFGFLSGVLGFVSTLLALPFSYISYFLLSYQLKVVEIFAQLPFASVHIEHFPLVFMLLFYVFYGFMLFKVYKKRDDTPSGVSAV